LFIKERQCQEDKEETAPRPDRQSDEINALAVRGIENEIERNVERKGNRRMKNQPKIRWVFSFIILFPFPFFLHFFFILVSTGRFIGRPGFFFCYLLPAVFSHW